MHKVRIDTLPIRTKIIDIHGRKWNITGKEQNITWVKNDNGHGTCFPNCAEVIPYKEVQ